MPGSPAEVGRADVGVEDRHREAAERRCGRRGAVGSADPTNDVRRCASDHENSRSDWRIMRPEPADHVRVDGRPAARATNVGSAAFATTSRISSIAASATGPL